MDADASGMDFAERLSLWVNAFDAIRLQAVHQAIQSSEPVRASAAASPQARSLAEHFQQVRTALASAIAQDLPDAAEAAEAGYAPYQRRHLELQRRMELMTGPLREHVRHALARASTRMRQLAVLDAALEQVLAPREQALLASVAARLQARFEQRRQDGALDGFINDWRQALLAELDLRLEPVAGLVDALSHASDLQA
jgi:hypothetical protein